jgi:hypothetical protein
MRSVRVWVAAVAVLSTVVGFAPAAQADRRGESGSPGDGIGYWTEPSTTSIFRDSVPTKASGRAIALDAVRNEEESAQVVVRSADAFSIKGVTFSALKQGSRSIAARNLSANFVTYKHLNANTKFGTQQVYPLTRKAPAEFPDPLSNARTIDVAAGASQSIWLTVAVPKGTVAGRYAGIAKVSTTRGELRVPVSVDVRAVTLPDADQGAFNNSMWNTFNGELSWKPDGETIEEVYQYQRYSPQWWDLMEKVAEQMRRHRTNDLTLPLVNMLLDGDTNVTENADGNGVYTFDWSKIDQVVQFFAERGLLKRLEGFWVSADTDNWEHDHQDGVREVEIVDHVPHSTKGRRNYVNYDEPRAKNFIDQFIPALKAHVTAKGWADKYWMHIGDEPVGPDQEKAWRDTAARVKSHWPEVKLGDAAFHEPTASELAEEMSIMVPNLLNYNLNPAPYDKLRAEGKELWLYNCNIPVGNYLNRFIDQPQFDQRLTMWYAYSRGATGYLHYSMSGWLAKLDNDESKGDHYIVWPDTDNNSIESSVRYESLRDGIEDYETLNLLGQRNPGLARDLATAITQSADKYSPDVSYQARIRTLVLDAAAGKPVIADDLAHRAKVTTGPQWRQVDLGHQAQIDGVHLTWAAGSGTAYTVQISYDGQRWSTASSTTTGNGGDDFVGINGKARFIRVNTDAGQTVRGLKRLAVAGHQLAQDNVVGGRSYVATPAPNFRPDSGNESSDGLLADDFGDGRTYGFGTGQETATVVFDLGSQQLVDSARVHAYEEYPAYRPDKITIAVSHDGVNYQQKGSLAAPNDQSGIWYDFDFPPAEARFVKITFQKSFTPDASVMFVDEIEVYRGRPQ